MNDLKDLKEYFSIEDLKGYDCYEMLKDLSEKIDSQFIAELLQNHGGSIFYIPNIDNLRKSKIRFTQDNKNISSRILARKLKVSSRCINEYKNVKNKV